MAGSGRNSAGMATCLVAFDSPGSDLQLWFWVGGDGTKRRVAGRSEKERPAASRRPFRDVFFEFETERSVRSSCTEKMNDRARRELSIDVHVKDFGVKTSRLRPVQVDRLRRRPLCK